MDHSLFRLKRPGLECSRVLQVVSARSLLWIWICEVQYDISFFWHAVEDIIWQLSLRPQLVKFLDSLVLSFEVEAELVQEKTSRKHIYLVGQTDGFIRFLGDLDLVHCLLWGLVHWSTSADWRFIGFIALHMVIFCGMLGIVICWGLLASNQRSF